MGCIQQNFPISFHWLHKNDNLYWRAPGFNRSWCSEDRTFGIGSGTINRTCTGWMVGFLALIVELMIFWVSPRLFCDSYLSLCLMVKSTSLCWMVKSWFWMITKLMLISKISIYIYSHHSQDMLRVWFYLSTSFSHPESIYVGCLIAMYIYIHIAILMVQSVDGSIRVGWILG